ncbi:MAG: hypothetical protein LBJ99_04070 [Oscillospiraceae bacterium]|jgi:hypothetical protein|nr:hypothetical protein [Oscillospiraceae bacterium]
MAEVELTVFIAAALAFGIKDIADIRRDGERRDLPPYLAAVAVAVCAGAALILSRGGTSVMRFIGDALRAGG